MLTFAEILDLLSARGAARERLFARADALRRARRGDVVPIRGIVEFSNVCARDCAYCGIRAANAGVRRYTIGGDEILRLARTFREIGAGTIVLQSGEPAPARNADGGIGGLSPRDRELGELVRRLKRETALAVTLSVGERSGEVYAYWRDCGMDRYLLRFETADPELYARLHGGAPLAGRLDCLRALKRAGVQTGGGFLIGLPGETPELLARNIQLCRQLELDMIGAGPFIPAPDTPLADSANVYRDDPELALCAIAVLRLVNPDANIPATTALDAFFPGGDGRLRALQCGANVFMPNFTPPPYREAYQLYPGKPSLRADAASRARETLSRIRALGRTLEY